MQQSNFLISFIAFVFIWLIWSIWIVIQPVLDSAQVALLLPLLSVSALLVAFSLIDNEDDGDGGGGILQPIYRRVRP